MNLSASLSKRIERDFLYEAYEAPVRYNHKFPVIEADRQHVKPLKEKNKRNRELTQVRQSSRQNGDFNRISAIF